MYNGRRFNREQVCFVVDVILSAAMDRIEEICHQGPKDYYAWQVDLFQSGEFKTWTTAAKETAGMALATFYAQLTDDGLCICDALEIAKFDDFVDNFLKKRTLKNWKGYEEGKPCSPSVQPCVDRFVEYFEETARLIPDAEKFGKTKKSRKVKSV